MALHALEVKGDTFDHPRTHCQGNSKTGIQINITGTININDF